MSSKSSSLSVRKSAISAISAVIITAVLIGSIVGGAGYIYNTQTDAIVSELKSDNSRLSIQVRTSQEETAKLNSQIGAIQDEGKQLNFQNKIFVDDNSKLKSQLGAVQDDNGRLKSLNDNLNSRIRASDEDNRRLRSQINDLNGKISDVNEKIVALSRSAVASFEFIPQPENIRAAYATVPAGLRLRFLKFATLDSESLSGALWEPENKKPDVALLLMHGTGSNYTGSTGTQGLLWQHPTFFASKGYAALAINDRQNGPNVHKKNLWDVPKDIGAGVAILKSLGYSKIVLVGYSLGGQHIVIHEALTWDPAIKGLILVAPVSNNPWRIQNRYALNDPLYCKTNYPPDLYQRLYASAKDLVAKGLSDAILPEKMPWVTCRAVDISAISFLTYYSPEGGVTNQWIGKVSVPVLYVRDQADMQSNSDDARWMWGNATAPGSRVPSIKQVTIPNTDLPSPANHVISVKNRQALLDTMLSWLQEMRFGQ